MINSYEIFHGFKNYLQKRALVTILGTQTRLSHSQTLACIDLLFSLAPETNEKKVLAIHKLLSTLSNDRLLLLQRLLESPHEFRLGGRRFQLNQLSHLRYFIGCAIVHLIESRLKELGISHDKVYEGKLERAYEQLRANRQALRSHANISLKDFVAGRAADHVIIHALTHNRDEFTKIIPTYAKNKLKALDDQNTKLDKKSTIVETYLVVNLCVMIALYYQSGDSQKPASELETNFSTLVAVSLILSTLYKLYLLHQKVGLFHEKVSMHSLFHEKGQQKITDMCAEIAHENIHQSNQALHQGQAVTLGRR